MKEQGQNLVYLKIANNRCPILDDQNVYEKRCPDIDYHGPFTGRAAMKNEKDDTLIHLKFKWITFSSILN